MEREKAAEWLSQNLKTLFAFSLSRLYDKDEAEDLTNDIVCAVLQSVHRPKDDGAFYGYVWRIAENTFKTHIRRKRQDTLPFDEGFAGACRMTQITPEEEYLRAEDLRRLRCELALLSRQYRETAVAYYIHGKSCSEISQALGISREMVKYHLFKTRKLLKEGFGMTREFGEKSYNPGTFRMDYWGGGDNSRYWQLFERKLPGNILLSAYYAPATLQELATELGVAAVYLEDELELLLRHELLRKNGNTYQTNILIFTEDFEREASAAIAPLCRETAERMEAGLESRLPVLEALPFHSRGGRNLLRWTFANLTLKLALDRTDERGRRRFGDYPPLTNGSYGFIFGYDNDYAYHHFNGIYGRCENKERTAWFSVENYRILEKRQLWKPVRWTEAVEAMGGAILEKEAQEDNDQLVRLIAEGFILSENGRLSANFPVFSSKLLDDTIRPLLEPLVEEAGRCMEEACRTATQILKEHAPKALLALCGQIGFIRYSMDAMALLMEALLDRGYLTLPAGGEIPCIFGVRKDLPAG